MKKLSNLVVILFLVSSLSFAQNIHQGKIGLGLDDVNSPNLLMKYFFSDNFAGQVIVGFDLQSLGGDEPAGFTKVTGTDFRIGLGGLYHFNFEKVSPYFGVEAMFRTQKAPGFYITDTEPDAQNYILANIVLGGEFFLNEKFSLGIKHTLGFNFELSQDKPKHDTNVFFDTGTVFTGRFYFN
ncbi:MAG: hypothetical protein STSR0008_17940 [Ignavibacterium sp.]